MGFFPEKKGKNSKKIPSICIDLADEVVTGTVSSGGKR